MKKIFCWSLKVHEWSLKNIFIKNPRFVLEKIILIFDWTFKNALKYEKGVLDIPDCIWKIIPIKFTINPRRNNFKVPQICRKKYSSKSATYPGKHDLEMYNPKISHSPKIIFFQQFSIDPWKNIFKNYQLQVQKYFHIHILKNARYFYSNIQIFF